MNFQWFGFGKRETEGNAGCLDDGIETNRFQYSKDLKRRNGSVLQYSKSIKYGTPDEMSLGPCSNIPNRNSGRNYEPDFVCVKGTPERIHEPGFGWKGKEKTKEKVENENERFSSSLDKPEFNISKIQQSLYIWNSTFRKVQRSLNVWNLTFRRFTPAFTLALDI
ncbi:unnamed protein product [Rhizophagus irregularis]|nr:unnamed protein product [Rhizophagus irregularis]